MAAPRVQVHISLSREMGKIMNSVRSLRPSGYCDVLSSLRVAQLTLKNRQNKTMRQRIVLFVASPLSCSSDDLVAMGKKMKKNNVMVDLIHFGYENLLDKECLDPESNCSKVKAFMAAVDNDNTSRLVEIPTTSRRLSDDVLLSPIGKDVRATVSANAVPSYIMPSAPAPAPAAASSTTTTTAPRAAVPAGVDPEYAQRLQEIEEMMELDPELATILRMSLDEAYPTGPSGSTATTAAASSATTAPAATATPAASTSTTAAPADTDMTDEDDEALLAAIALSMMLDEEQEKEDQEKEKEKEKKEKDEKEKNEKAAKDKKDDEDEDADDFMNTLLAGSDKKSDE